MEIQFLGHACFRLKGKKAILVTDPYHDEIGFGMPKVSADVVTISHHHQDHNNFSAVTGTSRRKEPLVISGPGEYEVSGIFVFGLASFHDQEKGAKRGPNTVYLINMDGLRLVHLGDLGETLNESQLEEINGVDVLFVPAGGVFTLEPKEIAKLVGQIQPKIVIPMHYQVPKLSFKLKPVDEFLAELEIKSRKVDKLVISREKLPEEREAIVFKSR